MSPTARQQEDRGVMRPTKLARQRSSTARERGALAAYEPRAQSHAGPMARCQAIPPAHEKVAAASTTWHHPVQLASGITHSHDPRLDESGPFAPECAAPLAVDVRDILALEPWLSGLSGLSGTVRAVSRLCQETVKLDT